MHDALDSFVLVLVWNRSSHYPIIKGSRLVTQTQFLPDRALFTLDHAAPVETAETVFLQDHRLVPVAPLATQKVTSAHVQRRAVAHPPARAQRTRLPIGQAEVRRLGRVDEILLVWRFDVLPHWNESLTVVPTHHFGCPVEALKQTVAHLAEERHFLPAGPQSARARQPVTFTFSSHIILHRLQFKTQR